MNKKASKKPSWQSVNEKSCELLHSADRKTTKLENTKQTKCTGTKWRNKRSNNDVRHTHTHTQSIDGLNKDNNKGMKKGKSKKVEIQNLHKYLTFKIRK